MWNLGAAVGNLGHRLRLPEMGISEFLGGPDTREYTAKTTPGPVFRNGQVAGLQAGQNVLDYNRWLSPTNSGAQTTAPAPTSGGPAWTGSGDRPVGWNGEGAGVGNTTAQDLAYQRWRSAIDQANRIRNSGKATFDDLIKSVTGFRDRAKTQFGNADQQITNTGAERLGSAARSAYELAGQGRAQGRALGLGDSSKFNRQQKVNASLAADQGATTANIGENRRANQGVFDERLGQADQQEGQANSYLRQVNDAASGVESAGVDNYGSALQALINYQQQLAAINPLNAGGLQQYAPNTNGLQNALGGVLASQAARPIAGADMGNPALSPYDDFRKLLARG